MSDRVNGLYVTLDKSFREDDVEYILNAIRMVKGVLKVEMNVVQSSDYFTETRVKSELRDKLYDLIKNEL